MFRLVPVRQSVSLSTPASSSTMLATTHFLLLALPWQHLALASPVRRELSSDADHSVQCSQVGDPAVDPSSRWDTAMAQEAFTNATNFYNENRQNGNPLSFDDSISHFFNGPENYDCQLLASPCDGGVGACNSVTSPAGWLILMSLSNFHNVGFSFPISLLSLF